MPVGVRVYAPTFATIADDVFTILILATKHHDGCLEGECIDFCLRLDICLFHCS